MEAVNGRRQMVRHDSDTLTNKVIASTIDKGGERDWKRPYTCMKQKGHGA